jgi:magnesium transporter
MKARGATAAPMPHPPDGAGKASMPVTVLWLSGGSTAERHQGGDLEALLARDDGFVWVDIPKGEPGTTPILSEVFRFHPIAVQDCLEMSRIGKIHAYSDHVFVALHTPEAGTAGQVHLLPLNQFIGRRYLVTVHKPIDAVPIEATLRETSAVVRRIEAGRFCPGSPSELSYAIVSAMARRMEAFVATLAAKIAALERQVMESERQDSHEFLEELFRLRHELLTLQRLVAQNREMYARMSALAPRFVPPEGRSFVEDLLNQFDRVRSLCEEEKEFLQGVVDFYQTRTAMKMNLAMERLALITALVMPVTAIASVYGMNIIVSEGTRPLHLAGVLTGIGIMTGVMFRWAKRQGWW